MKMFEKIATLFIRRTSLCFTLFILSFMIGGSFAGVEKYAKVLAPSALFTILWFSVAIAVSFGISDFIKKNVILRRTVQFILSYLSVVLVIFPSNVVRGYLATMQNPAFSVLMISFVFVIIYTAIAVAVLVAWFIKNRIENSSRDYENMFDDKEKSE